MVNYWWDEHRMQDEGTGAPTILAIGDSWFWYPFYGGSLVNHLGDVVRSASNSILATGMNGAEAWDYVEGRYARRVREMLRRYGPGLASVFISGGGNDFAGFADLRPMLRDDCSAAATEQACFGPRLAEFFEDVDQSYRRLVGLVHASTGPGCRIVLHTYDYAIPDGSGVLGPGWLKPALEDARVPPRLQQGCVNLLIDRFAGVLRDVCGADPTTFSLVDSRGLLATADWANELHPTGEGFSKLAWQAWRPVLQDAGLAR